MASKERMRLTDAAVARLRPREREYAVWDTCTPGLGVRIRPSSGASFALLYKADGRSKRRSLGSVMSRSVDSVRRQCHEIFAELEPDGTAKPAHGIPLFRTFIERSWKQAHFPKYKPSTRIRTSVSLGYQFLPTFGTTRLDHITRPQVLRWFDAYSRTAPGGANRTLQVLRQILNFAIACYHIATNPTRGIKANRRTPLMRFLSCDEIRRLHRALDAYLRKGPGLGQQAEIIRLLLLTGCRRNEIVMLRWSEVHERSLALGDSKTGPRTVPLNSHARRVIERQSPGQSPFVFPSLRQIDRPRPPIFRCGTWCAGKRPSKMCVFTTSATRWPATRS